MKPSIISSTRYSVFYVGSTVLVLWISMFSFLAIPAPAQAPSDSDPALIYILLWQLDRGDTAKAEKLLRENLPQMEKRLEQVLPEIDQDFDIVGRFGAVSIRFGPGYTELDAKTNRYEKLFSLYRKVTGNDNLYQRFEVRRLRIDGAHLTNEAENICGRQMNWDEARALYVKALENLEAAFPIAQNLKDSRMMASVKNNIGSTQLRLLNPEKALESYMEGIRYADQLQGDLYKGLLRLNVANVYVWIGQPDKAIPYAQEALEIFRKIGRGTWEANALMTLGNAYLRQQKFATAWETLNLTLQVAQKAGEYRVYGRTLLNLGVAGLQTKMPDSKSYLEQALKWYQEDDEIYPSIEREAVLQDGLRLMSQIAQQAGNSAQSEQYTKQYLELLGADPNRYQTVRQSPCFAIYMGRPVAENKTTP
ncbi:MAG: hypothetical protein A3F68_02670 [Acidobacteria bacterium RIFCSPLOWO2_12_FULL_54_10]|nr:MAG: hypothetical protein A3F68_02670 [Acidobacteria bacterium RIFCSPLOWO2_12_FULL_54_10]